MPDTVTIKADLLAALIHELDHKRQRMEAWRSIALKWQAACGRASQCADTALAKWKQASAELEMVRGKP